MGRRRWQVVVVTAATAILRVAAVSAEAEPAPVARGVRPLSTDVAATLSEGLARSATLRRLVEEIEERNGLVTLESASRYRLMKSGLVGATSHAIAAEGRIRVVHVAILTGRGDAGIATLGHELRHVAEILASDATNQAEVDALYRRIGMETRSGVFETSAAQQTTDDVRRELKEERHREGR